MLDSLLESLITGIVNGAHRIAERRHAPAASTTPTNRTFLGEVVSLLPGLDPPCGPRTTATLSPDERLRHVYVVGSTGCGKTNLLLRLIEGDVAAGRGICVVDLRGDLTDRVLARLAAQGSADDWRDRLLLMDLRDENTIVPFNPLAGPGDAYGRALHVLSVIRYNSESWGVQLEETLRNALVALASTGGSLLELEPLLGNASFRGRVVAQVSDRYVREFFRRYDALSEEKQTAWRLPVLNKVSPLLCHPRLRLMLGQHDSIDLGRMMDRPGGAILISLAVDRLHGAAHLMGGLLIAALQNAVMARVDVPERMRVPVSLYVDEFETMAADRFESIVAEGRRFGLGLVLSHQNLSQLPAGLRQVIRNNVHTQLLFQTGAVDASDLAREVVSAESRTDIAEALMTQCVGEAFLVRRGRETVRIRVPRSVEPNVSHRDVAAMKEAAFNSFGVSRATAENDQRRREEDWDRTGATPGGGDGSPSMEVRHGKRDRFHPKPPKPV
jgi:hypothetical protein